MSIEITVWWMGKKAPDDWDRFMIESLHRETIRTRRASCGHWRYGYLDVV